MMNDRFELHHAPAPAREAEALLDAAFGLSRRTKASYRLREGSSPLEDLSFHVRHAASSRLAGVISFWPLRVSPAGVPALLLGPLAVHPDFQRAGLGTVLMNAGLGAAREAGHGLVFLVGDEPYYGRHGFRQVPMGQVLMPGPYDPARLLYHELRPGAMAGVSGLLLPEWRWRARHEAAPDNGSGR